MCNGHTMTDPNDDDQRWLETVLKGLGERSDAVKQALMEAVAEREDAGPLLGTISILRFVNDGKHCADAWWRCF